MGRNKDQFEPKYPNYVDYNGAYAVNTQNRYEPLGNNMNGGNTYNVQSPRPPPFLGREMRGHPRGHSRGNRPWRGRPNQSYHPPNPQEWWNPPEWEEQCSPARFGRPTHEEAVEQGVESRKKKTQGSRLSGIYNLSKATLTQKETNILNAGLKCTSTKTMNTFNVCIYR